MANATSPVWQSALDRYYREVQKGGMKESAFGKDFWDLTSPEALIEQITAVPPEETLKNASQASWLMQLKPVLLGFNDFIAIVSLSLGMDGRAAALLWGSIRMIIKVTISSYAEIMPFF